jgi:hypothetical protein
VEATRTETTLLTAWARVRTADQVEPELKRECRPRPSLSACGPEHEVDAGALRQAPGQTRARAIR